MQDPRVLTVVGGGAVQIDVSSSGGVDFREFRAWYLRNVAGVVRPHAILPHYMIRITRSLHIKPYMIRIHGVCI